MKQNLVRGLLAATFAACTSAVGTPVIAPRASSTVIPVTVSGNGMSVCVRSGNLKLICLAFYQGTERFYIRGVDYAPGTKSFPSIHMQPLTTDQVVVLVRRRTQLQTVRAVNETFQISPSWESTPFVSIQSIIRPTMTLV
jgi:hypothetical protein